MAAKKQMSVEEILAACRRMDGGGGDGPEAAAEAASSSSPSPPDPAPEEPAAAAPAKPAASKPPGQMNVQDILDAARAEKSEAPAAADTPAGSSSAKAAAAGGAKPGAAKPAAAKKPGEMSVADMLAAARGEKTGAKTAPGAVSPKTPPKPKPAAKAAEPAAAKAKAAAAKPSGPKPSGPKDTASILAAARKGAKPGPITKAEAAARSKTADPVAKAKPARTEKTKLDVPPMPARPSYVRPQPAARTEATVERRGFLALVLATPLAVGFSTLAVTNLLWLLGFARFMFPNILTEPPTQFKVGFPDEYGPGQVEEKFKAQFGVWIVRHEYEEEPQIYALKSVCTHLGCTPNWLEGEQKFKCPCHGSGFYKDGINFEGPAPRPLERYAIRLADDGQLEVDKSRTFNQELDQWTNAASYVTV